MQTIYLIFVVVLFLLAISDLIVGVSNDAVNFLNSAIGSKAAPFKIIMVIAALGVLFGAIFSGGMMEVARKGIFNPEMFYFNEIMVIFLAVMLTDVILLDLFNTMGLPTSTTVSIVFELLGAAVGVTILKIIDMPDGNVYDYINTSKALAIISGILLSVVVAFSFGAIVQYITRLFFSFKYQKTLKYFGSIWGGMAIAAITYFILIKGAKGSTLISKENITWIKENTLIILSISFVGWTIILQLLNWIFKINILKVIVLVGTFALAMAFAGNDLVNFIGVPLAGYSAFNEFINSGLTADAVSMEALAGAVKTPTLFLILAGVIMVLTLWFSKKSRSVVATTLNLSRQDEGEERFDSFPFSRAIVRASVRLNDAFTTIMPKPLLNKMNSRFEESDVQVDEGVSFDLVRASVNLVVASVIISFATSLKLPLSTTYVTFMVAMGTSLADKAWGRESAVYRISGVIVVIAGWFFTALIAFTVAFILSMIISYLGVYGVAILIALAVFLVVRSHLAFKRKEDSTESVAKKEMEEKLTNQQNVLLQCNRTIIAGLSNTARIYDDIIKGLATEKRSKLKIAGKEMEALRASTKKIKSNLYQTLNKLSDNDIDNSHNYVQIIDYIREVTRSLRTIYEDVILHVDNKHKGLNDIQKEELSILSKEFNNYSFKLVEAIKKQNFNEFNELEAQNEEVLKIIRKFRKNQVTRIKNERDNTKKSLLFLNIMFESKNIMTDCHKILKIHERFITNVEATDVLKDKEYYG